MNVEDDDDSISICSVSINQSDNENTRLVKNDIYKKKLKEKAIKLKEKLKALKNSSLVINADGSPKDKNEKILKATNGSKDKNKTILETTNGSFDANPTDKLEGTKETSNQHVPVTNNNVDMSRRRADGSILAYKSVSRTSPRLQKPKRNLLIENEADLNHTSGTESFFRHIENETSVGTTVIVNTDVADLSESEDDSFPDRTYKPPCTLSSSDSEDECQVVTRKNKKLNTMPIKKSLLLFKKTTKGDDNVNTKDVSICESKFMNFLNRYSYCCSVYFIIGSR